MAAKRKAAPRYVWVARGTYADANYRMFSEEPRLEDGDWEQTHDHHFIDTFCCTQFERMTGIVMPVGTCRRFEWRSPLVVPKAKKRKAKAAS